MSLSRKYIGAVLLALGTASFAHAAVAADQPTSLLVAFNRIPKTPATLQEADKMLDARQRIPAIVLLKAELEAHAAAVEPIVGAADAKIRARMGTASTPEQAAQGAAKGAAAAGIDIGRMQTDKVYAQEVQAKMKAMSPQELMAMSAAMQQGMGMRGSVAVYDAPAVKAAAQAGQALMQPDQQAARAAATQRRWAEVDQKVAAVHEKFAAKFPKRRLVCDGEGGGRKECLDETERYVAAMMPLLHARDAEVLRVEAAAVEEERAALAKEVLMADRHLQAAQYGAASQELGNPAHILFLDQIVAGDIKVLATKVEDVVRRAALITRCGAKFLGNASDCTAGQ